MATLTSGILGSGGSGGNTGTLGNVSVFANDDPGGGVPGAGAGGGTGAEGTAGKIAEPVIVGVAVNTGGAITCKGGALGTVRGGAFTPTIGNACGVDTGTGTP